MHFNNGNSLKDRIVYCISMMKRNYKPFKETINLYILETNQLYK